MVLHVTRTLLYEVELYFTFLRIYFTLLELRWREINKCFLLIENVIKCFFAYTNSVRLRISTLQSLLTSRQHGSSIHLTLPVDPSVKCQS